MPCVEIRQLDVEDRGLQRVDAEVAADVLMKILRPHAVHAEVDQLLREGVVIGRHRAGIAEGAEVLRREKREAADRAEGSGALAVELRADRLRRVFDDRNSEIHPVHVGALSVEVHRHDRLRLFGDRFPDLRRIDVVVGEIDVDEHRRCVKPRHDARCGEERVRRHDDFITRTDAEDHESDQERVGARRERDAVFCLAIRCEIILEIIHALAEDEVLRLVDLVGDPEDFVADRRVLELQIEKRNGHARECKRDAVALAAPESIN